MGNINNYKSIVQCDIKQCNQSLYETESYNFDYKVSIIGDRIIIGQVDFTQPSNTTFNIDIPSHNMGNVWRYFTKSYLAPGFVDDSPSYTTVKFNGPNLKISINHNANAGAHFFCPMFIISLPPYILNFTENVRNSDFLDMCNREFNDCAIISPNGEWSDNNYAIFDEDNGWYQLDLIDASWSVILGDDGYVSIGFLA